MGAEKGCDWIKACLDYYQDRPFVNEDGSLNIQTVPDIMIRQIEQIKPIRVLSLEDSINIRKMDMEKEVLEIAIPTTGGRLIGSIGYFFEPILLTTALLFSGYSSSFIVTVIPIKQSAY